MKRVCFCLFLFAGYCLSAQDSLKVKPKKIALGFVGSPDYVFRVLEDDNSNVGRFVKKIRDKIEFPRLSFSGGLSFMYLFSKNVSFESGLLFVDRGYSSKQALYSQNGTSTSHFGEASFTYHYYYLDMPLKFNFNLYKRDFKLYLTTGIVPGAFVGNKNESTVTFLNGTKTVNSSYNSSSQLGSNYNKISIGILAGMGLLFDLNKLLAVKAEPILRLYAMPLTTQSIKEYHFSGGLNIGLYFKI